MSDTKMMNKKNLAPLDTPTANALEMQSTLSTTNSLETTTTTTNRLTSIHVTALDGIVSVNSLFTMAIFIGFSLTVPQTATATTRPECHVSPGTLQRLIVFEIVSFSFFLFSSLIAQSMKLAISLMNTMNTKDPLKADVDPDLFKYGLFASAIGSVSGCVFLMLSIIDFVQVKLGRYSCGGHAIYGIVALVILVGTALIVYITTAVYAAFFVEVTTEAEEDASKQAQT